MDEYRRLMRIRQTGGGEFGPEGGPVIPYRTVALFDYDALGRPIRPAHFDKHQEITDDTLYYYDGQRVLAEFDYDEGTGEQSLRRYFVDGPLYVDEHLLMHDARSGQDYYYLLQELYTIAGLVDENGDLIEAYAYDAYGDVRVDDSDKNVLETYANYVAIHIKSTDGKAGLDRRKDDGRITRLDGALGGAQGP